MFSLPLLSSLLKLPISLPQREKNDVIVPFYSNLSASWRKMFETYSAYSLTGVAGQSNEYSELLTASIERNHSVSSFFIFAMATKNRSKCKARALMVSFEESS